MPKSSDKTKGAKKRRKSPSDGDNKVESSGSSTKSSAKKKKTERRSTIDGIEKSRQLKEKLKRPCASGGMRTRTSRNKKQVFCGNGKPMPPLSELERMYEDSEGDDDPPDAKPSAPADRCSTPETKPDPTAKDEIVLTPNTLKNIASRMMDMITDATVLDENDGPPPQVIPQRKPNKSGIPFIVGCKERKQVPWAPKSSFCKGSPTYGVEEQPPEEELQGENIGPHYANISKSIFNAQSEEIAERLKELERLENLGFKVEPTAVLTSARSGSPDSNKTVPYDFPDSPKSGPRSFSPLPSTSKDSETILKNDKLFNESLKCDSTLNNTKEEVDDVQVVEVPCETIIIDDNAPDRPKPVPMDVDPVDLDDTDCCVIVETESFAKPKRVSDSPIEIKDEIYGNLDLTHGYNDSEVCEIIDVDDVISENKALLDKYKRNTSLDSVIFVEPSTTTRDPKPTNSQINSPPENSRDISNDCIVTSVENRSNIRDIVTNFFRGNNDESPNHSGQDRAIEIEDNITNSPNVLNSPISRILSWLTSVPCRTANSRARRKRTRSRANADSLQNSRSTEVTVGTASQQNAQLKQQTQQMPQQTQQIPQQLVSQQQLPAQPSPQKQQNVGVPKGLGDCPICMDSLSNNAVASTLCGHIFCMECIKAAVKANGKRCPTCRKVLKGVGFHQLFL